MRTHRTTISIPTELMSRYDAFAKRLGMPVDAVIMIALKDWYDPMGTTLVELQERLLGHRHVSSDPSDPT